MLYDLHRHLTGSCTPETAWKIIQSDPHHHALAKNLDHVKELITYAENDKRYNFHKFLNKFRIFDYIKWTEETIDLLIKSVIKSASDEGLAYVEFRFSINKYLSNLTWNELEVLMFISDSFINHAANYNIKIGLILAIKYDSARSEQKRISRLLDHWVIGDRIHGIDLVSDEAFFDETFYTPIFRYWKLAGKGLTIHVAESQPAVNARIAITKFKVNRISHGIRIPAEDPDLLKIIADNNICIEIALTSNIKTGVVANIDSHPILEMIEAGCSIILGTDDPVILGNPDKPLTLKNEFKLANDIGIDNSNINKMKLNAKRYCFNE